MFRRLNKQKDFVRWKCGLCAERYYVSLDGLTKRKADEELNKAIEELELHMKTKHPQEWADRG